MRPIDADALKEEIDKVLFDGSYEHEITEALDIIEKAPTIEIPTWMPMPKPYKEEES